MFEKYKNRHTIGWKWIGPIPDVMVDDPEKFQFAKPTNPLYAKTGYTNCPPTKNFFQNLFVCKSPVNIHAEIIDNNVVFPKEKNDVRDIEYSNLIQIHGDQDIEHKNQPVIQVNLNYLFVSDDPCTMEVLHPWEHMPQWPGIVTSGIMDIQKWIRPISWGFVWRDIKKPLIIKKDDALCYVRFVTENNKPIDLIEMTMTEDLQSRISSTSNVTNFTKRSAMSYIKTSFKRRPKKLIVAKDSNADN